VQRSYVATLALTVLGLLLVPSPARASAFGEENVTLGAMLAEQIKQSAQMAEALTTAEKALTAARDTVRFASDAVQVVQNAQLIVRDPIGYLTANARQFAKSFPESRALLADGIEIRNRVSDLRHMSGHYDPYALDRTLVDLRGVNDNAYALISRAVDQWGIYEANADTMQTLRDLHGQTNQLVARALTAMNPQLAAVSTAQSSALAAEAAVQQAAMMNELLNIQKQHYMDALSASNDAKRQVLDSWRAPFDPYALDVKIHPWSLDLVSGSDVDL
jgi:hypothetical protein